MGRLACGLRVLLVEDDSAVAEMYRLKLELDGYLVRVASDGDTGLSIAKEFAPDIAVVDIHLPGMNGLALLDALLGDRQTTCLPVVILTNDGDPEVERLSLTFGAREVLIKSKTSPSVLSGRLEQLSPTDDRP